MQHNGILPPEASVVSAALKTTNRNSAAASGPGLNYHPILQSLELQRTCPPTMGLHPVVVIALSVVAWFLAVMWLNFTGGPKVGLAQVIVAGIFVMLLTLVLLAAPKVVNDPRWRQPKASFSIRMMRGSLSCSASHCCQ